MATTGNVMVKSYASPTSVLLAFDWPDGAQHADFLGFAIRRTPGFPGGGNFLFNKLDFTPIKPTDKPKPSDKAPIQKFNWWDSGFSDKDRGKKAKKKAGGGGPPPIHVHHKFIVIDGDTKNPTIYSGSPNFSASSENGNDENVLEIKGNSALSHVYVAEFMRLYNHYRARALWEKQHGRAKSKSKKGKAGSATATPHDALVLKRTRDGWAGEAYKSGTKAFLARTRGL